MPHINLDNLPYSQMYLLCITDKTGNFDCNNARQIFGLLASELVELQAAGVIRVDSDSAYIEAALPEDLSWTKPIYDQISLPFNENKLKSIMTGFNAVFTQKNVRAAMQLPYEELVMKNLATPKKAFFEKYQRYLPDHEAQHELHRKIKAQITRNHPSNPRLFTMAYILHISRQLKLIYGIKEAGEMDKAMQNLGDITNADVEREFTPARKAVKACLYSGSVFGFM